MPSKGFKIVCCGECCYAVNADPGAPYLECHYWPPTPLKIDVAVFPKVRPDTWACQCGLPKVVKRQAPKRKPKAKKEVTDD